MESLQASVEKLDVKDGDLILLRHDKEVLTPEVLEMVRGMFPAKISLVALGRGEDLVNLNDETLAKMGLRRA
jgi:hypothetical protein